MTSRARDTWTAIDLCTAGNLARSQADIERLQQVVDQNGYIMEDGKLNPAAVLVETLTKRTVSLARALHVHAVATVGESKDGRKALANERNAAQDDDDLIPTLSPVVGLL
ncbi:TerS protein [Rhodoferax sp.]|uniref:TerS protein n=1 Tax=Rhodoferax sp. TaxID=50421 RepID=UPI0027444F41|nr:TerS protein [Rhodoferax sp.]